MRIILMFVAVATVMLMAGCKAISGPKGPSQPGTYLNKQWGHPIVLVNPLETKEEQKAWSNDFGASGVDTFRVVDIDKTFEVHSEAVIHPGSAEFELDVYPGSSMYGLLGGMTAAPADYFKDYKGSTDSIKVLYIGEFDLGSKDDPKPISKFSVFLISRGRYLIDAVEGEGRILVEW